MILNINDFIMFETRKDTDIENSNAPKSTKITDSASNELINESSNTNYSIDDEDGENDLIKTFVAKIVSVWKDNSTDKLMIAIRYYYRPEQLKNELITNNDIKFEDCNELISTNQYDVIELTSIKSKCFIMDLNKFKEKQQEQQQDEDKNDQNNYFYRYQYDFNEKKMNLLD